MTVHRITTVWGMFWAIRSHLLAFYVFVFLLGLIFSLQWEVMAQLDSLADRILSLDETARSR